MEHTKSKSLTITGRGCNAMVQNRPATGWKFAHATTHPGLVLLHDFLEPLGINLNKLAVETHVPATRIGSIVKGTRSVTPDTALRFAQFFGTSPEFWLNLQQAYDLSKTRAEHGDRITHQVQALKYI